jgi:2-polyprenyl-3-methyl-5-hydroxy-6-metoxy-1,4-benzoquinol methylase
MIDVNRKAYPYLEEVNEGVLREFRRLSATGLRGRVLDVGCGRGQLGAAIRSLGWEVWGIEAAGEACPAARARLDRLIEADLHDHDRIERELSGAGFAGLLFSDVLEHLYDPRAVLESYLRFVHPGGRVFVSVPNVLVWTNRLRMLFGRFDYSDTGALDRTHIRFFTFRTARELVRASGCAVERTASTPHLARAILPALKWLLGRSAGGLADPRVLIDSRGYKRYMRYVYPVEQRLAALWRTLFAFRIIVVGRKPEGGLGT